jgi:hypothetical protein
MKLREALEHEICAMEFNAYLIDKTNLEVEDMCIGVLFKNNHTHIVQPNTNESKKRLLNDITFWFSKER